GRGPCHERGSGGWQQPAGTGERAGRRVGDVASQAGGRTSVLLLAGAAKEAFAEDDAARAEEASDVRQLRVFLRIEAEEAAGEVRRQPSGGANGDSFDRDRVLRLVALLPAHRRRQPILSTQEPAGAEC